jgi:ABC-type phosphate transport system substrate-binding protein
MGYQLGIDIGTANTVVALADGDWPRVLTVAGSPSTPTALYFPASGPAMFGRAAQRRALADPARATTGFLARVGESSPVVVGGAAYLPEGLVTRFLERLLATVVQNQGGNPDRVTVAFPTSWNQRRRELFTEALDRLDVDFPVTAVPAADAVGAVVARRATGRTPGRAADLVALFDFGAGSCETAVLSVSDYGSDVVGAPTGLSLPAAASLDSLLFEWIVTAAGPATAALDRAEPATAAALARLHAEVVTAKEALAADEETQVAVALPGVFTSVPLRRADLERLATPTVEDGVRALVRTVRSVPTTPEALTAVLLYGGASRMPLVERLVRAALPGAGRFELQPAEDLSVGAALLAEGAVRQGPVGGGATVLLGPVESLPPEIASFPSGPLSPVPATTGAPAPAATGAPGDQDPTALVGVGAVAAWPGPTTGGPATGVTSIGAQAGALPTGGGHGSNRPARGGQGGGSGALRALRTRGGIAALIAAVVFIAGATVLGVTLTSSGGSAPNAGPSLLPGQLVPASAGSASPSAHTSSAPPVVVHNLVKVADSEEVAPISELAFSDFHKDQANVTATFDTTTTSDAFTKLCTGQVAVAGTSYELDPSYAPNPDCKNQVVEFEIAHHTLPVVVNPANTWMGCQTVDQLQRLWAAGSTITHWNQLDSSYPNEPIDFVGPATDSVQAQMFDASITGSAGKARGYTVTDLAGVAQSVEADRDAIGFLDFPTYETAGDTLRGILINGGQGGCQPPNAVTAGTGLYLPLCKPLYLYVRTDALRDPATAAYVRYYLQNEQSIATASHYVPRDDATVTDNVNQVNQLSQGVGPVPS